MTKRKKLIYRETRDGFLLMLTSLGTRLNFSLWKFYNKSGEGAITVHRSALNTLKPHWPLDQKRRKSNERGRGGKAEVNPKAYKDNMHNGPLSHVYFILLYLYWIRKLVKIICTPALSHACISSYYIYIAFFFLHPPPPIISSMSNPKHLLYALLTFMYNVTCLHKWKN